MIRVTCPKCNTPYNVKDALAGKSVKCKKCDISMPVPAAPPEAVDAAVEQAVAIESDEWTSADIEKVAHLKDANENILEQLRKAVVGQDIVVRLTMLGLFAQGHCLLMLLARR